MASTETPISSEVTANSQSSGTSSEVISNLQQEIVELKAKLEGVTQSNKQSIDGLGERLKLGEEFAKLREDVNKKFLFFRWSAVAIVVVGGIIGVKSVSDYTNTVKAQITGRLDHIESYYYELLRGSALLSNGQSKASLSHFRWCFDQPDNHYDEGLLVPFLNALDEADDWEQASQVMRMLKEDFKKYDSIKSPWVWGNLASLQIQMSLEDEKLLPEAHESLHRYEYWADPNDVDALRAQHFEHWMLALVERKPEEAKKYFSQLALLPQSVTIDSWEKIRAYRFTKVLLSKNITTEKTLKDMVMPLKDRFKKD